MVHLWRVGANSGGGVAQLPIREVSPGEGGLSGPTSGRRQDGMFGP